VAGGATIDDLLNFPQHVPMGRAWNVFMLVRLTREGRPLGDLDGALRTMSEEERTQSSFTFVKGEVKRGSP